MADGARQKPVDAPAPSARCAPGWYAHGAGERPARVQLDLSSIRLQAAEVSGDYNIWHGRYAGDRGFARSAPAATRCHLDTDAGLTLADHTESNAPICLHFARGACAYGSGCNFRHRAPLDSDESSTETRIDVFGRERHASFRDDMGGVGSWARDQRTLYVGRVCVLPSESEVHATVYNHFSEWGEIDYCRVLMAKGCAFVSYKLRCAAEFAKEAMADQALEHDEQLNVRWATEDPNPRAKAERLRVSAQLLLAAMRARGHAPPAAPYADGSLDEGEEDAEKRAAKRARLGGAAAEGGVASAAAPRTRAEAEAEAVALAAAAEEEAETEAALAAAQRELEAASRLDSILGRIDGAKPGETSPPHRSAARPPRTPSACAPASSVRAPPDSGAPPAAASPVPSADDDAPDLPPGVTQLHAAPAPPATVAATPSEWVGMWDGASGQPYWANPRTGESRWAWEWAGSWAQNAQPEVTAGHEQWAAHAGTSAAYTHAQWAVTPAASAGPHAPR